MQPIVSDLMDQSYFLATYYMYFPFLTCEVKCGARALNVADRQNAHSTAIAVRAAVELFRLVQREKEIHREILAFSISHDHRTVRIYGYYAEIADSGTKYYRSTPSTLLHWTAETSGQRTNSQRMFMMLTHFKRICSVIDEIPADISFSMSESELRFQEQSGLSQDFSTYSIVPSSANSGSAQAQVETQSSVVKGQTVTPNTSVTKEGVFKKPRRDRTL